MLLSAYTNCTIRPTLLLTQRVVIFVSLYAVIYIHKLYNQNYFVADAHNCCKSRNALLLRHTVLVDTRSTVNSVLLLTRTDLYIRSLLLLMHTRRL